MAVRKKKAAMRKKKTVVRKKKAAVRKKKAVVSKRRQGLVSKNSLLKSKERKIREKIKREGKRLPHGYELVTSLRAISGLTKKQLKEMLQRERVRLRHGYELKRRKRVSGIGDLVGVITKSQLSDIIKHYTHVMSRLIDAAAHADSAATTHKLDELAKEIKRHIEYLSKLYNT